MSEVRILVVTKNVPWPANSGEKQRALGVIRALTELGHVTVVAFAGPHDNPTSGDLEGVTVRAVPEPARLLPHRLLARALRHRSITAAKWWDRRLAYLIAQEALTSDVILIGHVQLAAYLPRRRPGGCVTALDMHNVESVLTRRLAQTSRSWRRIPFAVEAWALERLERRQAPRFDLVTVVSEADRRSLARVVSLPCVRLMPNAVSISDEAPTPADNPTACFVGLLSWRPNVEAAVYFTQQVWPLVRQSVPGAHLLLVGRDPAPEVIALAAHDVTVTGTVDDLIPWYARSRVALAPLLAGGGSRLKILEALSLGRPLVATSVGAEGLEDLVGRGVVVADDNESMAVELAALLSDPQRAMAAGAAGAAAVRQDHSWGAATGPLVDQLRVLVHVR